MKKWMAGLLTLLLSTMISAQLISNEEDKKLREIIEPLNEKFVNSIMENNLESYLSLYTEDAVVMLPFMSTLNGRNALTVHWHNKMTRGEYIESANVITLDIWSSGNLIYERGSYQITFKKFENKPRAVYGSYFSVWVKQPDGSYKMKYDISNLDHGV
jgi:ketosteroid isomerase-like protein